MIINDLEWISLRSHFKRTGIFSWDSRKARVASLLGAKSVPALTLLFKFPNILFLFVFRVLCCIALLAFLGNYFLMGVLCIFISGISIIISIRGNEGTTGADSMAVITIATAAFCLTSQVPFVWKAGLTFIGCQLALAYATAGWLRIVQPTWRSGADLLLVLRQVTYGNKMVWNYLVNRPKMAMVTSMAILLFECSAPFVLFMPVYLVIAYLCIGLFFHISNAIFMGLNTFFWAFGATYLPFLWLSVQINLIVF